MEKNLEVYEKSQFVKEQIKVVLIRTPIVQPKHHMSSLRAVPSIGLAYIASALRRSSFSVKIIDAPGESLFRYRVIRNTNLTINGLNAEEILAKIPQDVSAVGLSAMHASEWIYDSYILKKIHQRFPDVPLFLGGENATATSRKILEELSFVKAIVLGEGDHTAPILVEALLRKRPLSEIKGIAYRDQDGAIKKNPRLSPENQPDIFKSPDWEGFPLEKYFHAKTSISAHNERSITMLATRGCPHACTFCTVPNMWNSKWSSRTPQNVVDEMIFYKKTYDIEHIDFVDLTFALNKLWTKEFCELLLEKKVNLRWSLPIGTRVENLDFEILQLMRRSGCVRVLFSPESGSKLTLVRIKKKLNISKMENVIRQACQLGLTIKLATIFGFPGQSLKEAFGTIVFIWKSAFIGVRDVVCLSFIPYPGTELHDQLVQQGLFDPSVEPIRLNNDIKSMVSWSEDIPNWAMALLCFFGMFSFYFLQFLVRPWRLVELTYNIFIKRRPQTNLESLIYCFIFREAYRLSDDEVLS